MLGREAETPASTDAWDACPASLLEGGGSGFGCGAVQVPFSHFKPVAHALWLSQASPSPSPSGVEGQATQSKTENTTKNLNLRPLFHV